MTERTNIPFSEFQGDPAGSFAQAAVQKRIKSDDFLADPVQALDAASSGAVVIEREQNGQKEEFVLQRRVERQQPAQQVQTTQGQVTNQPEVTSVPDGEPPPPVSPSGEPIKE